MGVIVVAGVVVVAGVAVVAGVVVKAYTSDLYSLAGE